MWEIFSRSAKSISGSPMGKAYGFYGMNNNEIEDVISSSSETITSTSLTSSSETITSTSLTSSSETTITSIIEDMVIPTINESIQNITANVTDIISDNISSISENLDDKNYDKIKTYSIFAVSGVALTIVLAILIRYRMSKDRRFLEEQEKPTHIYENNNIYLEPEPLQNEDWYDQSPINELYEDNFYDEASNDNMIVYDFAT